MSLVEKLEAEVEIKSAAEKFHEVFSSRLHHVSSMSPTNIHGLDLHEGEIGKQGTLISWTYSHKGEKKVVKQAVEEIDDDNKSTKFKVIEGDLMKHYKQFWVTIKVTPKEEGSIVQWIFEYEKKQPENPHPNTLRDVGIRMTKDIDHYLQNN